MRELLYGQNDAFGQAGYVEYVMDYVGLAQRMIELAQNPELAKTMGENGYNRVSTCIKRRFYCSVPRSLHKSGELVWQV